MFTKVEISIGVVAVLILVLAFTLAQDGFSMAAISPTSQTASVGASMRESSTEVTNEAIESMELKIDDIRDGTGEPVTEGDTVAVHYVGTLQNGIEFDNSRKRGEPIEFTIGAGQVIAGWEQGIVGMRVGGERTLVIPS